MPPRQTDEDQAVFGQALKSVAEQEPIPQDQLDTLSVLEGSDLDRFREVFSELPAGARARLIRALHDAAEQRLRLDFNALNRLAMDDADAQVRLAGVESTIE